MDISIEFEQVKQAYDITRATFEEFGANHPISVRALELFDEVWLDFKHKCLSALLERAQTVGHEEIEDFQREMDRYEGIYRYCRIEFASVTTLNHIRAIPAA